MTFTLVRRLLVVGAILALASVNASATTCAATLASLITAGTCTIGDLLFGNFQYTSTGTATAPTSAQVNVTPVTTGTGPNFPTAGLQLDFATNSTVVAGQTMDLYIQYSVVASGYHITEVSGGAYGGIQDNGISGTGDTAATYEKWYCPGAAFTGSDVCASQVSVLSPISPYPFATVPDVTDSTAGSDSITGNSAATLSMTTVGMYDHFSLVGGADYTTGLPQAAVWQATNIVSEAQDTTGEIPEPATLLLIGSALIGLGVLRRKRA